MFEFFAGIKHFQKHKQHTSKDAEFIALHDDATSAIRFKCYNTWNDKFQQLYGVTNKLHKCLNFLLELNIFKNTNNTHQKMQNPSLYTIKDSSSTRFKCYNTSNDKIQQLYADSKKLQKCLKFLLQLNIFKNTNNTHQKMRNSSLYTIRGRSATRLKCYITWKDKIQQLYADTNKLLKSLNFLLDLNIFKNTNNTHQKMQNSSLYTMTPVLEPDSNATIHQTTRFSNCMPSRTNCITVWVFCWN